MESVPHICRQIIGKIYGGKFEPLGAHLCDFMGVQEYSWPKLAWAIAIINAWKRRGMECW